MTKVKVFENYVKLQGQVQGQGQKLWYNVKGLVTRNSHVKYETLIFCGS